MFFEELCKEHIKVEKVKSEDVKVKVEVGIRSEQIKSEKKLKVKREKKVKVKRENVKREPRTC